MKSWGKDARWMDSSPPRHRRSVDEDNLTVALEWFYDDSLYGLRYSIDPQDVQMFRGVFVSDLQRYMCRFPSVKDVLFIDLVMHDATGQRMSEFLREINDYVDDYHSEHELPGIDTRKVWTWYCAIVVYNTLYAELTDQDVQRQSGKVIIPYERPVRPGNDQVE